MNQDDLMSQYLRLQRKLSVTCQAWHSGRVDRLTEALRNVERQLHALQSAALAA